MARRNWKLVVVVFGVALLPRLLDLGAMISPDEPQWQENTLGFLQGLREKDFSALYQQHHPGITTMWLAAPAIESGSWAVKRAPQVVALALLIALSSWLMMRLWGEKVALAGGLMLALNPLFMANSRVLAMDALLAIFLLLSALFLLLWQREKIWWWGALSGVATALAVLSKIPGVVIGVWAALFFAWQLWRDKESRQQTWKAIGIWAIALALTLVLVFPTIVADPVKVYEGIRYFFEAEQYQYQQIHALGSWWYPQALLLWTTPLHWLGLLGALIVLCTAEQARRPFRELRGYGPAIFWLLLLGVLFFTMMQISLKKGDRYILPDFLLLDVLTVLLAASVWRTWRKRWQHVLAGGLIAVAVIWQVGNLVELHPHYLAYRNPFFRSVAEGRTMGWGEGLDVAAEYLNKQPGARELLIAAYWEHQLEYRFTGHVTPAEQLVQETPKEVGADYVVLYRAMQGRARERWETKVLAQFADKTPEKVIRLNGEEYVWIYRVSER